MADGGKIRHNDSVLPCPTIKTRECTTLQERTVIGQHNEGKEMPVGKGDVLSHSNPLPHTHSSKTNTLCEAVHTQLEY
jgi:hypothetical protein